jgi:RNA polymerase sigma-70 factor, ECF subfamily
VSVQHEIIDGEQIKRIKSGDQIAFALVFRLLHKKLCSYAYVYVRDYDVSDEIVQETFIKLWESKELLKEDQSLCAYIYKCVHNNCINYIKKQQVNSKLSAEYINTVNVSMQTVEQDFDEELIEKLMLEDIESRLTLAINGLPGQCREIFLLSRFGYLSYQEIADKLAISVNTVKTQISRAFQKIRTELTKN